MLHQADFGHTDLFRFQCTNTPCVTVITPFPLPLGFAVYLTGLGCLLVSAQMSSKYSQSTFFPPSFKNELIPPTSLPTWSVPSTRARYSKNSFFTIQNTLWSPCHKHGIHYTHNSAFSRPWEQTIFFQKLALA